MCKRIPQLRQCATARVGKDEQKIMTNPFKTKTTATTTTTTTTNKQTNKRKKKMKKVGFKKTGRRKMKNICR